jgi:2-polyprenyl-6-methoxyphenol hydroxylase-like FAD-dependent oxidoreductase
VSDGLPRATRCCVAGGGPAGLMLGLLLARVGIDVVVLEKHADFLRDFRGDTIHPSTLQLLHELGLLEDFLREPHQKVRSLHAIVGGRTLTIADFSRLPVQAPFVAFVPQWNFLDFLARAAAQFPSFRLAMAAEAADLVMRDGIVAGVRVRAGGAEATLDADLVVAADGRGSRLRAAAGLAVEDLGAPIDVVWFRLPKRADDPGDVMGRFEAGAILVTLDRGDYWQCAFVIPKGGYDRLRADGIVAFRARLAAAAPHLADRVETLRSFDDTSLLTVRVDRLPVWHRPGFLCIGDAAHAMSPIGGVGINLAIQDAVAAANILSEPLKSGAPSEADLAAVRRRRWFPTRATQALQVRAQDRLLAPLLGATARPGAPLPLRLVSRSRLLQGLVGRLIGLGLRPEHVTARAAGAPTGS